MDWTIIPKIIMVVFLSVILISLLSVGYYFYSLINEKGFYNETFEFSSSFSQKSEFTIILPTVKINGNVTPAMLNPKITSAFDADEYADIKYEMINESVFLMINGYADAISLYKKSGLPDIGSKIGYEDHLSNLYLEDNSESNQNNITGTYFTLVYVNITEGVLVDFEYTFRAVTNYCDSGINLLNADSKYYEKELETGWNEVDNPFLQTVCS